MFVFDEAEVCDAFVWDAEWLDGVGIVFFFEGEALGVMEDFCRLVAAGECALAVGFFEDVFFDFGWNVAGF